MHDDTWQVLATKALTGDSSAQNAISGSLAAVEALGDPSADDPALLGWVVAFRAEVLMPALLDAGCLDSD